MGILSLDTVYDHCGTITVHSDLRGKHCRKFEDTHTILRNHLPNATETGCMGICKGPVVQVDARYFKSSTRKNIVSVCSST